MEAELFEAMKNAVLDGDEQLAEELAQTAIQKDLDVTKVMNEGFLKGIQEAGDLYQAGDFYLPELVSAADAMKKALEILTPVLQNSSADILKSKGKVVLATVQGDVHDIGKMIVGAMLTAAGYEIYDLGADVPNETVIETVRKVTPDVLGLSALLTTTMQEQKNIIGMLEQENLRDGIKVIIGGAPVSARWSEMICADGYSDNAMDAVKLAERLLG